MSTAADRKDEFLYYRRICAPDLPEPDATEYQFWLGRKWRADFVYHGRDGLRGLLVEIDGGQWTPHGGRHATDSDREKGNKAAALGYLVLHVSPQMLDRDPSAVFADVREALARIGR